MARLSALGILIVTSVWRLDAMDIYPDVIPPTSFSVTIEDFAVVPYSSGQPARISVVTADPQGRLFAIDQRGPMYWISDDGSQVIPYLNLNDYSSITVLSTNEAGFQGFAFHPAFHDSGSDGYGRFYTIHSTSDTAATPDFDPGGNSAFHTVLLEWETDAPDTVPFDPANEMQPFREIMRLDQPYGNHNAGNLAFNPLAVHGHPDWGNLYLAIGDGGSGGDPQENAEDTSNPYGAILRIDPLGSNSLNGQYGIVLDNDLADDAPPVRPEIFCYGLRNPQRFGWDVQTGTAYIADIGQNHYEEINILANGANYGWDTREGSQQFEGSDSPAFSSPVAEYDHTNMVSSVPLPLGNRAVTLGEVVRGSLISNLDGQLLFGDIPTGLIFVLNVDTDPLDGGQDGIRELVTKDTGGNTVRLNDLVQATRFANDLDPATRIDVRFSLNTQGRIFISNKRDSVIRRLVPDMQPSIQAVRQPGGLDIDYQGRLQWSLDLESWREYLPQPGPGELVEIPDEGIIFLRSSGNP